MTKTSLVFLSEALRGSREKVSILLGLIAVGFLGLSIYIFGTQAKFSLVTFPAFICFTVIYLYYGRKASENNAWFLRLFLILNGMQVLLSLAGWIWVLYLAQENPGGRYDALVNLPFYFFILFFLITFLSTFSSLMLSLIGVRRKRK